MRTKNNFKEHLCSVFLFSVLAVIIFYQFFFRGLIPFPGNYMLAWYEPWKTDYSTNGTITIPHKPVADDVFRQLYPSKVLISDFIKQMQFPLWNPYNGSGMPFLATMHVSFLNPLNLLFVFLPKYVAWGLYVSIQPILISFFTYLYCRKIGMKFMGALFSSASFVLSGPVIVRLLFGEYIYNFWILPLLLYLIESYINNPKAKVMWLFPFAITFLFITGQPQIITYILIFSFCYLIYRKLSTNSIFFVITLTAIGVGLAGIQLLPTLELFGLASIGPSSSKFIFDRFLLPIEHLVSIFIPNYFGNQSTYNYWGSGDYIESIVSIGLIPCFFALIGIGRLKTKIIDVRNFFLLGIVLTTALTLDWIGTRLLFSTPISIISTGIPSRVFALTVFCISVLAGYGFDKWVTTHKDDFKEMKKYVIKFFVFVIILLAGTFLLYFLKVSCNNELILNCRNIALRNTLAETGVFAAALFLFWKKIPPFGIILLVLGIGIYNSNKFLPFSAKEAILPQHTLISQLQKIKDGRVFGLGEANIKTNFATHYRFYDPNYYDPLYNKRYGELIDFANTGTVSPSLSRSDVEIVSDLEPASDAKQRRDRLFDILSVRYLILKKPASEQLTGKQIFWQNNDWTIILNKALPFSFTVNKFEIISNSEDILSRLFEPSFNPQTTVVLETKPNALPTDRMLVVSENYYPGWKAFVDNKEAKIYRANYTFRAIVVPRGKHNIKFEYQPESLKIGMMISSVSLVLLVILYLVRTKFIVKK